MGAKNLVGPKTPTTTPSAFNNFTNGIVDGAKWCGRQISWFCSKIADYACKAGTWAKNFFVPLAKFTVQQFKRSKEFLGENKKMVIACMISATVGATIYGILNTVLCKNTTTKTG